MPPEPPDYAHCAEPEPPVTMMLFHFSGGNPAKGTSTLLN